MRRPLGIRNHRRPKMIPAIMIAQARSFAISYLKEIEGYVSPRQSGWIFSRKRKECMKDFWSLNQRPLQNSGKVLLLSLWYRQTVWSTISLNIRGKKCFYLTFLSLQVSVAYRIYRLVEFLLTGIEIYLGTPSHVLCQSTGIRCTQRKMNTPKTRW